MRSLKLNTTPKNWTVPEAATLAVTGIVLSALTTPAIGGAIVGATVGADLANRAYNAIWGEKRETTQTTVEGA